MHEFSIALNIIEIAELSALQHDASGVTEVEVEVGNASGINAEALEFSWESAIASSNLLKKSKLMIHTVPLLVECNKCKHRFTPDVTFESCPACGEISITIIHGQELKVKSIMLADH
jgi:hydrogenase nickel incorporation protein HypA/HybF